MTMINPYGIGAGRAIAEQYDDGPDKVRKESRRRETALQIADRERLQARLQQSLTEAPDTRRSAESKNANATVDRAQRKRLTDDERRLQERLLKETRIAESDAQTPEAGLDRAAQIGIDRDSAAQPWQRDLSSRHPDTRLPASLLSCIDLSPARLTRERALSTLDSLKQALNARHPSELLPDESDGVHGYLDFLDGYFEAGTSSAGPSAEMASLMEGIRVQLNLATDPAKAGVLHAMSTTHPSMDNPGRGKPVSASSGNDHRKVRSRDQQPGVDDSEDVDRAAQMTPTVPAALTPTAASTGAGSQGSQSSPGRDTDRRREETMVSITLKSV
jgi:hypothetical protein